jgi:lambda family phage portal protein
MNLYDRILLQVAPKQAWQRARYRHLATNLHDGFGEGSERRGRQTFGHRSITADNRVARDGRTIRDQARCLEETYDIAEAVISTFVKAIIGHEVIFEPQVMSVDGELHAEVNDQLRHWYKVWARRPEVTWEYDYHEGCRQHIRSYLRDGDVFQQYVQGFVPSLEHGSDVPLSLEHIEADFCPINYSDPMQRIVQGVEKNAWGRAVAYWLYKTLPGEYMSSARGGTPDKRVPRDRMIHQKNTTHFRQTRGISILAPVLSRFEDIKDIEESERVAARCAAAMVGVRKRGTADDWMPPEDDAESTELGFEPGMWYDLEAGEDIQIHASNRPNNQLIAFMGEQMRRVSGGTGANASSISKNFGGTYSSQRQEMVEGYVGYGVIHADTVNAKLYPDWVKLVETLVTARLIDIPADVVLSTLYDVDIPRPAMPWIDPQKEANAFVTLVDAELESPTHVMRMRGRNPVVVRAQIEADRKWRLAQKQEPAFPQPPEPEEPEEPETDDDENT